MELQGFPDAEVPIQRLPLEYYAYRLADAVLLLFQVETCDGYLSALNGHKRCQDVDGGGFSCAVWSQKTENLPFFDVEADVVHRGDFVIVVAESFNRYYRFFRFKSPFATLSPFNETFNYTMGTSIAT